MRAGRCGVMACGVVVRTLPTILTILAVFACARGRQPSFQGLGGGQLWPEAEVAIECWPARNGFGRRAGDISPGWHRTSEYFAISC